MSAVAVALSGAALSLAAGSAHNVELNVGAQCRTQCRKRVHAGRRPGGLGTSVTAASVHTVPAPVSARQASPVQPLAAEQPPVPPAPPETPGRARGGRGA